MQRGVASFAGSALRSPSRWALARRPLHVSPAAQARARGADEGLGEEEDGQGRLRRIKLPPASLESTAAVELDAEQKTYLTRVLRLAAGDAVEGFDGRGRSRLFELAADDRRMRRVSLVPAGESQEHAEARPAGVPRTVVWLPLLRKDRLEWAVEKLAELGLDALQFYRADRSRPGRVDFDRLRRIRDEAERQSMRYYELELREEAPGLSALAGGGGPACLWFDIGAPRRLQEAAPALKSAPEVALVIGPEGGFSDAERAQLQAAAGPPTALDGCSQVLKADTAALAALILLQSHLNL
eukprot:tig00020943_g16329.t1